jgi:hypothetical protein
MTQFFIELTILFFASLSMGWTMGKLQLMAKGL